MPAYLIVDTKIHDAAAYETYKLGAKPLAERHGGEYLVRGGPMDVVEDGLWTPTRLVIIRFPDMAAARAFVDDPDYQPFKAMRQGAAACTLALVEGM